MKSSIGMCMLATVAATLTLTALSMDAQEKVTDNMHIVREAMQAEKKLFIAANMQLTEAEAQVFWPIYDRYQQEQQKLNERLAKLMKEYVKQHDTLSDEAAQKLLDEALAIEADRQKALRSYLLEFRKVLPVKKVARYYQLENKIQAVVNYDLAAEIPLVEVGDGL